MYAGGPNLSGYGAGCCFKWRVGRASVARATVGRAMAFEAAIEGAEAEAKQYAAATDFEYLGLAQAFGLKADQIADGSEVFSLIRTSPLAPDEYINRFFDTGSERQ